MPPKKLEKERLAADIAEILGVKGKVDFNKLTAEELNTLKELLGKPANIWPILARSAQIRVNDAILRKPLGELIGANDVADEADKGPLGLGILPAARKKIAQITGK